MFSGPWDRTPYAMEARILRPLLWFGLLEYRSENIPDSRFATRHYYRKGPLFDRLLSFDALYSTPYRQAKDRMGLIGNFGDRRIARKAII